ncbi:MAG: helix-turn-helix domain-containing protein [Eubacteriales bacterium]
MKLNENIKKLRKENKFTQQQLADKLFVSQDSVSAWERNVSAPPTEYLPRLAAIFHVSIDDLFGDDF